MLSYRNKGAYAASVTVKVTDIAKDLYVGGY
jgi:hypothetical protein